MKQSDEQRLSRTFNKNEGLYEDIIISIHTGRWQTTNQGVKQGCTVSPTLFSTCVDAAILRLANLDKIKI
jgi:hypothetical protein